MRFPTLWRTSFELDEKTSPGLSEGEVKLRMCEYYTHYVSRQLSGLPPISIYLFLLAARNDGRGIFGGEVMWRGREKTSPGLSEGEVKLRMCEYYTHYVSRQLSGLPPISIYLFLLTEFNALREVVGEDTNNGGKEKGKL